MAMRIPEDVFVDGDYDKARMEERLDQTALIQWKIKTNFLEKELAREREDKARQIDLLQAKLDEANQEIKRLSGQLSIEPRQLNSYLRLIATAVSHLGSDQLNKRGTAAKLAKEAEALGLSISDNTIEKILKQVKDLVRQESRMF